MEVIRQRRVRKWRLNSKGVRQKGSREWSRRPSGKREREDKWSQRSSGKVSEKMEDGGERRQARGGGGRDKVGWFGRVMKED